MQSLNEITKNVEKVISYSQSLNNVNATPLINQWYEAKKEFIDLFGGECTYTYPEKVSFEIDEKTKRIEVDEFIVEVESRWNNDRLADFIYDMKDSFYSNTVSKDYVYNGTIITKGTKLIKAFKYFVENAHDLKEIQDAASRIIQKDKVEGYLTLSVHPLDYLSASENAHNWRSCHALDGDYRSGNLNYMVDDSTIICYLSSGKEEKLPSFPEDVKWNSKKWRVWLFLSNDREMMFAGRQYPFFTKVGLDMITNTIFPRFNGRYHWSGWHDDYISAYSRKNGYNVHSLEDKYIPVGGKLISMKDLIHENENNLFYNDLLESSTYTYPFYCYNANCGWIYADWGDTSEDTRFDIGADALCPVCGKHILTHTHSMVCDECEEEAGDAVYCEICDRRISREEEIVFSGWKTLCVDCARKFSAFCSRCGHFDLKEDLHYNAETGEFLCEQCYYECMEEEE